MRLRFTGQMPVSFMSFPYLGEVEPGEFEARDADAEVLLLRTDIESAEDPAPAESPATEVEAPVKTRRTATPKPPEASAAGPSPMTA